MLRGRRARLPAAVLALIAAALLLAVFMGLELRRHALDEVSSSAILTARVTAAGHARVVEGTRDLLTTLASVPQVRGDDPGGCASLLAEVPQFPSVYANFGVASSDGYVFCSALPSPGPVNIADRLYFRQALETGNFSVGEYQVGRITRKASINFGFPILDDAGSPKGVVFAAVDLAWLNRLAAEARLPAETVMLLVDNTGIILARHPEPERWVGRTLPEAPLTQTIGSLAQSQESTVRLEGFDGVERLYAIVPVGDSSNLYLAIGNEVKLAFAAADRALTAGLVMFVLLGAAAVATARTLALTLQKFRESEQALRNVGEMKDVFLEAVSHDLRTPLTSIIGFAETLDREELKLSPQMRREMLTRLGVKARSLERLVADLLDLDRLLRGIVEANRQSTEISALVDRVVGSLESRKHPLRVEVDPVVAWVDGPQVERVIENLVVNALKHTQEGTHIWVRVAAEREGVLITVEDSGPGVPDEIKQEIFDPFRRGGGESTSQGAGIGLALVAKFAELHGGRAWVEDREFGGASFKVFLAAPTELQAHSA